VLGVHWGSGGGCVAVSPFELSWGAWNVRARTKRAGWRCGYSGGTTSNDWLSVDTRAIVIVIFRIEYRSSRSSGRQRRNRTL